MNDCHWQELKILKVQHDATAASSAIGLLKDIK